MRTFWLMDQHGADGPTALVETNGSMRIVRVHSFGPGITELADQQAIYDRVMGKVAPALKPHVKGTSIKPDSVAPHEDLVGPATGGSSKTGRISLRTPGSAVPIGGKSAGGAHRISGRGDR